MTGPWVQLSMQPVKCHQTCEVGMKRFSCQIMEMASSSPSSISEIQFIAYIIQRTFIIVMMLCLIHEGDEGQSGIVQILQEVHEVSKTSALSTPNESNHAIQIVSLSLSGSTTCSLTFRLLAYLHASSIFFRYSVLYLMKLYILLDDTLLA